MREIDLSLGGNMPPERYRVAGEEIDDNPSNAYVVKKYWLEGHHPRVGQTIISGITGKPETFVKRVEARSNAHFTVR